MRSFTFMTFEDRQIDPVSLNDLSQGPNYDMRFNQDYKMININKVDIRINGYEYNIHTLKLQVCTKKIES